MDKDKEYIEKIRELLPRYCEGNVTAEESEMVKAWMAESEENSREVKQIHTLYWAADMMHVMENTNMETALSKASGKLRFKQEVHWWNWTKQVAAILFIPLLILTVVQNIRIADTSSAELMVAKVSPGMTGSVILPDGTEVYLNSGSTLTYPSRFNKDGRCVTLNGEAYFKVTKDEKRKFIISAPHQTQVEVLGTSFNMEAYDRDNFISTTLVEGKVRFLSGSNEGKKGFTMSPGQKLVYDTQTQQAKLLTTSGEVETAWKEGKIIFSFTPMQEVLRMLEKRYNVKFIVKNDKIMENSFTGTFSFQRLDEILEYFKLSTKINWNYTATSDISKGKAEIEIY